LLAWLGLNPNAAALGPTAGGWPLPAAVTVHPGVLYEFERKWIWLLYARAVAGQDSDVEIWVEG